ncbi:MAG: hypothetical protein KKC19_02025 [Nanoarchaeota archaeon]|nr:hypothetical protein [Nanoarchaeota archaeon]
MGKTLGTLLCAGLGFASLAGCSKMKEYTIEEEKISIITEYALFFTISKDVEVQKKDSTVVKYYDSSADGILDKLIIKSGERKLWYVKGPVFERAKVQHQDYLLKADSIDKKRLQDEIDEMNDWGLARLNK